MKVDEGLLRQLEEVMKAHEYGILLDLIRNGEESI